MHSKLLHFYLHLHFSRIFDAKLNKKYVEVKKAENSQFDNIDRAFMTIKMDLVSFFERLINILSSGRPQLLERLKNVERK